MHASEYCLQNGRPARICTEPHPPQTEGATATPRTENSLLRKVHCLAFVRRYRESRLQQLNKMVGVRGVAPRSHVLQTRAE